ncbi:hypothetical protein EVAR_37035_1 [Eumeta japonica]|uniref:Uncharacterized protein n=1 Tax=Eumeta variegata TaxID=151549 RepID=A0A4C1WFM5_EUMVA|nr:hypothetical protein EVAR_37035_1 [Eumeta japonica]
MHLDKNENVNQASAAVAIKACQRRGSISHGPAPLRVSRGDSFVIRCLYSALWRYIGGNRSILMRRRVIINWPLDATWRVHIYCTFQKNANKTYGSRMLANKMVTMVLPIPDERNEEGMQRQK